MRRILLFTLAMFVFCSSSFAQKSKGDEIKSGAFTIRVIQNADAAYGYELYQNNVLQNKQVVKPFQGSKKGFQSKENAIKVAQRNIGFIINEGKSSFSLDKTIARSMGVSEIDVNSQD